MSNHSFSHIGICVADAVRTEQFYCEALGFVSAEAYNVGNEVSRTMELDGVKLLSKFLRRPDGISIELLYFDSPDCFGPRERRPMNQFGLTHLSFYVQDLEAALAKVREHGGTVHEHTRAELGPLKLIFCTDPDGVRVELMQNG
jgi:catechol 2,3-dioxygenase-like lactoylglutathione lyase family enzyme